MATKSAKALTLDDVEQLIQKRSGISAKEVWIAKNMQDLPATYRAMMPDSADPNQLAASEQEIRKNFRDDFKRLAPFHMGYLSVNPDGSVRGPAPDNIRAEMGRAQANADLGITPEQQQEDAPVDLSKMTALEKMALGLKQSTPARGGRGTAENSSLVTTQTATRTKGGSPVPLIGSGAGQVNLSRMSATQKIALGLSMSQPAQLRR